METIRGKSQITLSAEQFNTAARTYPSAWLDLGTGDGRFVLHTARACPQTLLVGVDACRENLVETSRRAPANTLFVIANALALPAELTGGFDRVSINFPWGSLLAGLLAGDPALLAGLARVTHPEARLEVRLNASALAEAGWALDAGAGRVRAVLREAGFAVRAQSLLRGRELSACPTTWAKRLGSGPGAAAVWLR